MQLASAAAAAFVVAADQAPDTSGSDPIVLAVGVILVTITAVVVVIRQRSRG